MTLFTCSLGRDAFHSVSTLISTVGHEYTHLEHRLSDGFINSHYNVRQSEIASYQWEFDNKHITGLSGRALENVRTQMSSE